MQPVVFLGHGSPMNALADNTWTAAWRGIGEAQTPPPRAILAVSAHWYGPGTRITAQLAPPTIHDFGGFPRGLYEIQYPARGDGQLASRVRDLVARAAAAPTLDDSWGLDHGTWSVLLHLRPAADVPVLQLSIDARLSPADHLAIGRTLRELRHEGVMVLASGNITHNLRHAIGQRHTPDAETPPWARDFDLDVAQALQQRDLAYLEQALTSKHGPLAHPSPDHYLPLLYAAGAAEDLDSVAFPALGFDLNSLSMRSVVWGRSAVPSAS